MSLHLNLLHEIETQRAISRRDPLKITGYAMGVIGALFAIYYFVEFGKMTVAKSALNGWQKQLNAVEPEAKKAAVREAELKAAIENNEQLVKYIENRFYWAPVLEVVAKLTPKDIQITKLSGNATGEQFKQIKINLDGISAGADPRRVAEDFRQSLADTLAKTYKNADATFRQLEDGTESVTLDGKAVPTAIFAINIQFDFGTPPPATPALGTTRKDKKPVAAQE
jgi:hypothetical protein